MSVLLCTVVSGFTDPLELMFLLHSGVRGHDLPQRELVGSSLQTFVGGALAICGLNLVV